MAPHLQYGYPMFNKIPRFARAIQWLSADGARHHIAEIVPTPALGYKEARVSMDAMVSPGYVQELCGRLPAGGKLIADEYAIEPGSRRMLRTINLFCAPPRVQ
jgi:hypothetical protein